MLKKPIADKFYQKAGLIYRMAIYVHSERILAVIMTRKTSEFDDFHPFVNFIYFGLVIVFSMFLMHPIMQAIGFLSASVYLVIVKGFKNAITGIFGAFIIMLLTALVNPMLNHEGITIITYLPGGNPLTLESLFYGFSAGIMFATVICWFSSFNVVFTSDKIIYLFGRIMPSMSLIFSMVLRFVPKFTHQFKAVSTAQQNIGNGLNGKKFIKKVKFALKTFSIMLTWSLESSIETADSMKARGYGLPKRSAFSNYRISKRDIFAIMYMILFGAITLLGIMKKNISFLYFPSISCGKIDYLAVICFVSYFMLCGLPVLIECVEVIRWRK